MGFLLVRHFDALGLLDFASGPPLHHLDNTVFYTLLGSRAINLRSLSTVNLHTLHC